MSFSKNALTGMTKAELVDLVIEMQDAAAAAPVDPDKHDTARDVYVHSPAYPVHVFHGFLDAGGDLIIQGLPEDEMGHWAPFYELIVNDQNLGKPEIVPVDEAGNLLT